MLCSHLTFRHDGPESRVGRPNVGAEWSSHLASWRDIKSIGSLAILPSHVAAESVSIIKKYPHLDQAGTGQWRDARGGSRRNLIG